MLIFLQSSHIHHDKTGSVPDLVGKVTAGLHALHIETHIVAGRVAGNQGETQGVCAILIDDLQRVDTISQRLTHLPSQGIPHQSVNQYMMERTLSGLLIA